MNAHQCLMSRHTWERHKPVYVTGSKITGDQCVLSNSSWLHSLNSPGPGPSFYHPGKSESVINWKVSWSFNIQLGGGRDCQFSLLKESPKKQLPEEVTFIRGSSRQEDEALSDPAASQPIEGSSGLRAADVRLVPMRFMKIEGFERRYVRSSLHASLREPLSQCSSWDTSIGLSRRHIKIRVGSDS